MPGDDRAELPLRASDADRDRVAGLLGEALADGRITADEHRERIDLLYATRTHDELAPLTAVLLARASLPTPTRVRVAEAMVTAAIPSQRRVFIAAFLPWL